jgi:hypothetical protein
MTVMLSVGWPGWPDYQGLQSTQHSLCAVWPLWLLFVHSIGAAASKQCLHPTYFAAYTLCQRLLCSKVTAVLVLRMAQTPTKLGVGLCVVVVAVVIVVVVGRYVTVTWCTACCTHQWSMHPVLCSSFGSIAEMSAACH